jgi:putative SOS response-associated peptidase YedK
MDKDVRFEGTVRPSDIVPVIAPDRQGKKDVFPMRFGFLMQAKLLFNARTETASEKPTFAGPWREHRCIIPASWYFEWSHFIDENGRRKKGDMYRIGSKEGQFTYLCGLYRNEDGLPAFTVLTREPEGELASIHDRMPLILPEKDIEKWIDPGQSPELLLDDAVTDLFMEKTAQGEG